MCKLRKFFLGLAAVMLLTVFTGCNRNNKDEDKLKYAHLKADIIGAWCDENGPELVEMQMGPAHRFYEFTENGEIIYYFAYADMGAVYTEGTYTIDGNIFDSDGSKCRINVENDILTMTFDAGSSRYRRVGAAELLEYSVYAHGEALFAEQEPLLMEGQGGSEDIISIEGSSEGADETDMADETNAAENPEDSGVEDSANGNSEDEDSGVEESDIAGE